MLVFLVSFLRRCALWDTRYRIFVDTLTTTYLLDDNLTFNE